MITVSLGKFTCTISITNFRFAERDIIPRLSEALQLPHKTVSETVVQRCSVKKVFLEISQNSQGSTCARVSFLIKRLWHSCFPVNFAKFLRTPFFFFHRTPLVAASIVCCRETVANNIEALCILLLKRLSYPCHLSHMVPV